jgi:hypothetical protein
MMMEHTHPCGLLVRQPTQIKPPRFDSCGIAGRALSRRGLLGLDLGQPPSFRLRFRLDARRLRSRRQPCRFLGRS